MPLNWAPPLEASCRRPRAQLYAGFFHAVFHLPLTSSSLYAPLLKYPLKPYFPPPFLAKVTDLLLLLDDDFIVPAVCGLITRNFARARGIQFAYGTTQRSYANLGILFTLQGYRHDTFRRTRRPAQLPLRLSTVHACTMCCQPPPYAPCYQLPSSCLGLPPRRIGHVGPLELVVGRHPQHDAVRVGPRRRGLVAGLLDGEEGVGHEEPLVLRRLPSAGANVTWQHSCT